MFYSMDFGGKAIMIESWFRRYRLAPSEDDLHPCLNLNGAYSGKSLALLERDETGRWRPRPQDRLESILSDGYGFPVDLSRRMQSLETVAKAPNDNNPCRAAIALVQAQFPPLPDAFPEGRMMEADKLSKDSLAYLTQPRVSAGAPGAGQWTSGAEAVSSVAARSLRWLKTLGGRIAAPVAIAAGILFPDNATLESNGSVPDHDGLNYRFSEMRLTLIQNDGQGGGRLLFSGMPDEDGFYRDQGGTIVGRAVGNSFMLDDAGVAAINAATVNDRADTGAATGASSDEPRLCPDPIPDRKGGMSERAADYQQQITGLPRGMAVEMNGVMFDGCRTTDGTMLEAKGPGLQQHLDDHGEWKPYFIFSGSEARLEKQLKDQSAAAGGRQVEWHVAQPSVAANIQQIALRNGLKNVTVLNTPVRSQ